MILRELEVVSRSIIVGYNFKKIKTTPLQDLVDIAAKESEEKGLSISRKYVTLPVRTKDQDESCEFETSELYKYKFIWEGF